MSCICGNGIGNHRMLSHPYEEAPKPTPAASHAELRERLRATMSEFDLPDFEGGTTYFDMDGALDALIAAGFADVAAERARADMYRQMYEEAEAEHDALQALINEAPHEEDCNDLMNIPGFRGCDCWKSRVPDNKTSAPSATTTNEGEN